MLLLKYLAYWLIHTFALLALASSLSSIQVASFRTALVVTLLFNLLNLFVVSPLVLASVILASQQIEASSSATMLGLVAAIVAINILSIILVTRLDWPKILIVLPLLFGLITLSASRAEASPVIFIVILFFSIFAFAASFFVLIARIVPGFTVTSFWGAFWAAIVYSFLTNILSSAFSLAFPSYL